MSLEIDRKIQSILRDTPFPNFEQRRQVYELLRKQNSIIDEGLLKAIKLREFLDDSAMSTMKLQRQEDLEKGLIAIGKYSEYLCEVSEWLKLSGERDSMKYQLNLRNENDCPFCGSKLVNGKCANENCRAFIKANSGFGGEK